MADRWQHIEEFYELLHSLSRKLGGAKRLADCNGKMSLPTRGVYFFFEEGECRRDQEQRRIVRIGTHAVSSGSKTTLWNRLYAHRGSRSGGGNHRGSIFRLHVGRAMLNRDGDTRYPYWGQNSSAGKAIKQSEDALERQVSEYIGNMQLLWLNVDDEPSKDSHRSFIERNAIALLAGADGQSPVDTPSAAWLGQYSDHDRIRLSGLWNLDYIGSPDKPIQYEPTFLDVIRQYLDKIYKERRPKNRHVDSLAPFSRTGLILPVPHD
jgi:hypothetical protein